MDTDVPDPILPGGTLVSMPDRTVPEMPDDEFAARWAEITADLSDLDGMDTGSPDEIGSHSSSTETPRSGRSSHLGGLSKDSEPLADDEPSTGLSAASGPRDWTPTSEEADDFFDYDDALDILNPSTGPSTKGSRHSAALWVTAVGAIVVSLLMVFSVLPGGGVLGGALGLLGFACGAIAAFASSPHEGDIDPFDDGARV